MSGGNIFGICGGLQILGESLEDPLGLEHSLKYKSSYIFEGLKLLPIKTIFETRKSLSRKNVTAIWPRQVNISGFELHHGQTIPTTERESHPEALCLIPGLGWVSNKDSPFNVSGTYLHGIFDNGEWRRLWLNKIRASSGLQSLPLTKENYSQQRENLIDRLTDAFKEHVDLEKIL